MFAATLRPGAWTPLVVVAIAAGSDYVDGPLARRAGGPTRYGVLLDSVADIAFVLVATVAGVVRGVLSVLVPVAIACAAIPYLVATMRRSGAAGGPARAYSAVGHWAGVCNYLLVGVLAASVALADPAWAALVRLASGVVVGLNLAAVALRVRRAR